VSFDTAHEMFLALRNGDAPKPEPKKGEHWGDAFGVTPWIVNNPNWPSGEGAYLVLCPGCPTCGKD